MRSIAIHLKSATRTEVVAFLDRLLPLQREPWIVYAPYKGNTHDAALYVNVEDADSRSWSYHADAMSNDLNETREVIALFGAAPTCEVSADISGRHYGTRLTAWLAVQLLTAFEGVGSDDYVDRLWTLDEIRHDSRVNGVLFDDTIASGRQGD